MDEFQSRADRWNRLPSREKISFLLMQGEWIVFQALEHGVAVDNRSIVALVEAKRSMLAKRKTKDLVSAVTGAEDAWRDAGGGFSPYTMRETLNSRTFTYMCYDISYYTRDYVDKESKNPKLGLLYVRDAFLTPFGNLQHQSPIAKRLDISSEHKEVSV